MSGNYSCTTPGCPNRAIFDTNICDDCLENDARQRQSLENFEEPHYYFCGHCKKEFSKEEFYKHWSREEG